MSLMESILGISKPKTNEPLPKALEGGEEPLPQALEGGEVSTSRILPVKTLSDSMLLASIDKSLKSIRGIAMFFLFLTLLSIGLWIVIAANQLGQIRPY